MHILFTNIFFTYKNEINKTIRLKNPETFKNTIKILQIKKKNLWIFLKSKIISKKDAFALLIKKYKFIILLSKPHAFFKNIQKLWYLFNKINTLAKNAFKKSITKKINLINLYKPIVYLVIFLEFNIKKQYKPFKYMFYKEKMLKIIISTHFYKKNHSI